MFRGLGEAEAGGWAKAGWIWNLHAIDDGRGLLRPILMIVDLLQLRRREKSELEGVLGWVY